MPSGTYHMLPQTVEAILYDGDNGKEVIDWIAHRGATSTFAAANPAISDSFVIFIHTACFDLMAPPASWVVCDTEGRFNVLTAEEFGDYFKPASEAAHA